MESDFQIYEMASDITWSISKYWKQVNGMSDEGTFHISGHKIKVNFLFVSSSDSDIHDINNTVQLTFDLM